MVHVLFEILPVDLKGPSLIRCGIIDGRTRGLAGPRSRLTRADKAIRISAPSSSRLAPDTGSSVTADRDH
jgi:hypothetical protein